MNVTVKTLPRSQVKLTVEVEEAVMQKHLQKAVKQLSGGVKIPGFRPEHVPFEVLKRHLREGAIESHALELALNETYSQAVLKEKLQVISRPKINILKENPLVYEATVAIHPSVTVSGYESPKIKKNQPTVDEKDVENTLAKIQRKHATYHEVEREAKIGDRVEVDFEGYDEGGALLEKTKSSNHPVILGSESLVKGFEAQLVGLKKNNKKQFKIRFPSNYFHKPFQGKNVEFRVELKKVEEVILPEWTPEFIKKVAGGAKSMDEIKSILRGNLLQDRQYEEKSRRENEFLELLARQTSLELPEAIIEEEIDFLIEDFKGELQRMGVALEAYLEANKKELKDLRAERRKEAEKRLTLRFGLQKVFEQEKIEVTPHELAQKIEETVNLYPEAERQKMRKEYAQVSYLARQLENKFKMDKLFERFLGE